MNQALKGLRSLFTKDNTIRVPRDTHLSDRLFKYALRFNAWLILAMLLAMFLFLLELSWPTLREFGFSFFVKNTWNPPLDEYGALAFIYGTLGTSFIALLLSVPFSLGVALFLTELAPKSIAKIVGFFVEMLAAIPSVIYGLWGIFILAPIMQNTVQPTLIGLLGPETLSGKIIGSLLTALFYPVAFVYSLVAENAPSIDAMFDHFKNTFGGPAFGVGMLSAGIILSIMITPTITSITREVFLTIPKGNREAALGLGATRWEAIRISVLKASRPGVIGAVILGLGRALGETMAVTMVIGNRNEIDSSILAPAQSMASVIANEYPEAFDLQLSSLAAVGLALFIISLLINTAARLIVWSMDRK